VQDTDIFSPSTTAVFEGTLTTTRATGDKGYQLIGGFGIKEVQGPTNHFDSLRLAVDLASVISMVVRLRFIDNELLLVGDYLKATS